MAPSSCFLLAFFFLFLAASSSAADGEAPVLAMVAGHGHSMPAVVSFGDGYTQLFGDSNLVLHGGGKRVRISLDERTGAGFASQDAYLHGFFSASIKLPADYAAGVVVAFYMSNGDVYEKTHDELDFEFLGNIKGRDWRVQTNVYGNGSTSVGREERYGLWFDPTEDFHRYAILWSHDKIVFYIDGTPIREVVRSNSMGAEFPSKPMSLYATIWDGSSWATSGGRYKVDYKYAPFAAEFTDLTLHGGAPPAAPMSGGLRSAMQRFRAKHMTYGYCYDRLRYPVPPPECGVGPEAELFLPTGDRRGRGARRRRRDAAADSAF